MNIFFLTVSSCQLLIGISIITHSLSQTCCSASDSLIDTLTFQKTCGAGKLCVMREVLQQKVFYFMILHLPSGSMMYVSLIDRKHQRPSCSLPFATKQIIELTYFTLMRVHPSIFTQT